MPLLLLTFVLVSIATAGFSLVLCARQFAHMARHCGAVPQGFADHVTLADHQRAADYERARLRLGTVSLLFGLATALGRGGFGYDALYAWLDEFTSRSLSPTAFETGRLGLPHPAGKRRS